LSVRTFAALLLSVSLIACADHKHDERLRAAGANPSFEALLKVADVDAGAAKFGECVACHTISKNGPPATGPNLYGVFGQPMGQHSPRFGYSAAMRDAKGKWDAATLNAWIENPQKVVPGTRMQYPGLPDPLDRADLIAYLRSRSD
jgi:cytochrome c